jgi:hypothetical protein
MSPGYSSGPLISKLLHGEIERFRESIDTDISSNGFLLLAYWHVKLLARRHGILADPIDILDPALRMATIIDSTTLPSTPLNHHFVALSALTLVELTQFPEFKQRALKGVDLLINALDNRRGLGVNDDNSGWGGVIRAELIKRKAPVQPPQPSIQSVAPVQASMTGSSATGNSSAALPSTITPATASPSGQGGLHRLADIAVSGERSGDTATLQAPSQSQIATPASSISAAPGAPAVTTATASATPSVTAAAAAAATVAPVNASTGSELLAPIWSDYDFTALTRYGYLRYLSSSAG